MAVFRAWRTLVALLLIAATVQAVVVSRAALPALDALRSVAAAEALLQSPTWSTFSQEPEPPLFPVWLAAVHQARGALAEASGWPAPKWASSTQWAASLPIVLWVAPLYFFARRAFGHRTAWLAGLLACVLPSAARLGGEGIPDGLYLFLFTMALAVLSRDLTSARGKESWRSRLQRILGGALLALAMLVRAEAALLIVPIALGSHGARDKKTKRRAPLAACPPVLEPPAEPIPHRRTSGRWHTTSDILRVHLARIHRFSDEQLRLLRALTLAVTRSTVSSHLAEIAVGLALVLAPWLAVCGASSPSNALARLSSRGPTRDGWVFNQTVASARTLEASLDPSGLNFDSKEPGVSTRRRGIIAGLVATLDEFFVATGYVLMPLAWLGTRGRFLAPRRRAWNFSAAVGLGLWMSLALVNAAVSGYLSSRHLLPAAVFLLPLAANGLCRAQGKRRRPETGAVLRLDRYFEAKSSLHSRQFSLATSSRLAATTIMVVWAAFSVRPLHADRAGHRAAGEWLARRVGRVLDSWGWTALYSGRETYRYDAAREAYHDPRLAYVVVEGRELDSDSERAQTLRRLLGGRADCVAQFDPPGSQSPVMIFHWRPVLAHNTGPGGERR